MKQWDQWTDLPLNWRREVETDRRALLEALDRTAEDNRVLEDVVQLLKVRDGFDKGDWAKVYEFLRDSPLPHLDIKASTLLDAAAGRTADHSHTADREREGAGDADEHSALSGGVAVDEKLARRRPAEPVDAPPQRAELVLRFALPKDQREYLIGDLEEEFRSQMVPKFGYRMAARWYWVQVLKAVAAAFGARLRVWLGISALTSAVGWLVAKMGL